MSLKLPIQLLNSLLELRCQMMDAPLSEAGDLEKEYIEKCQQIFKRHPLISQTDIDSAMRWHLREYRAKRDR